MNKRETKETKIEVELKLHGTGKASVKTPYLFLNHMLESFAKHSQFDVTVKAESLDDIQHHLVEDVGIALGEALAKELGDKKGIERFGAAIIPMDESVATVAVDLGGRGYANIDLPFSEFDEKTVEDVSKDMIEHFLESFAMNGKMNLYIKAEGKNDHHKVEAAFKGLARALKQAVAITGTEVPSTKGTL